MSSQEQQKSRVKEVKNSKIQEQVKVRNKENSRGVLSMTTSKKTKCPVKSIKSQEQKEIKSKWEAKNRKIQEQVKVRVKETSRGGGT